ncbi:MAG: TIM barrel protein [Chloroflexota bacterium]
MNNPLALSSWTTHAMLGQVRYAHSFSNQPILEEGAPADLTLLDLPQLAASAGIAKLELCHFHFPTVEEAYLRQLKEKVEQAGIELENILLDTGNLSNPNDQAWKKSLEEAKAWQQVAAQCGAKGCRIDCGTEPPSDASKARAAKALQILADHGASLGLATTTENFRTTSVYADDLLEIMGDSGRPLQLCVDYGNAKKSGDKYGTLKQLLPHGSSIHFKAEYLNGHIDRSELHKGLTLARRAGFSGFITLIVDETVNEWEETLALRDEILAF